MNTTIRKAILRAVNAEQQRLIQNGEYLDPESIIKTIEDEVDNTIKKSSNIYES